MVLRTVLFIMLAIAARGAAASALESPKASLCNASIQLAASANTPAQALQAYVRFVKLLADRNALTPESLQKLAESPEAMNAMNMYSGTGLNSSEAEVFTNTIQTLIEKIKDGVDPEAWATARKEIAELGGKVEEKKAVREKTSKATRAIFGLGPVVDFAKSSDPKFNPEFQGDEALFTSKGLFFFTRAGDSHNNYIGHYLYDAQTGETTKIGYGLEDPTFLEAKDMTTIAFMTSKYIEDRSKRDGDDLWKRAIHIFDFKEKKVVKTIPFSAGLSIRNTLIGYLDSDGKAALFHAWDLLSGYQTVGAETYTKKFENVRPVTLPKAHYQFRRSKDKKSIFAFGYAPGTDAAGVDGIDAKEFVVMEAVSGREIARIKNPAKNYRPNDDYLDFYESKSGKMFLAHRKRGKLYVYDLVNNTKASYSVPIGPKESVQSVHPMGFYENAKGEVSYIPEPYADEVTIIDVEKGAVRVVSPPHDLYVLNHIFQTSTGRTLLVAQSHKNTGSDSEGILQVIDLDDGTTNVIKLGDSGLWPPTAIRETEDGRIEALYHSQDRFKAVQIFGPPRPSKR